MSILGWLIYIGLKEEAKEYAGLFKKQKYCTLGDLLDYPPSESQLKEYGITAGRDINCILTRLKDAGGTGI